MFLISIDYLRKAILRIGGKDNDSPKEYKICFSKLRKLRAFLVLGKPLLFLLYSAHVSLNLFAMTSLGDRSNKRLPTLRQIPRNSIIPDVHNIKIITSHMKAVSSLLLTSDDVTILPLYGPYRVPLVMID